MACQTAVLFSRWKPITWREGKQDLENISDSTVDKYYDETEPGVIFNFLSFEADHRSFPAQAFPHGSNMVTHGAIS